MYILTLTLTLTLILTLILALALTLYCIVLHKHSPKQSHFGIIISVLRVFWFQPIQIEKYVQRLCTKCLISGQTDLQCNLFLNSKSKYRSASVYDSSI